MSVPPARPRERQPMSYPGQAIKPERWIAVAYLSPDDTNARMLQRFKRLLVRSLRRSADHGLRRPD